MRLAHSIHTLPRVDILILKSGFCNILDQVPFCKGFSSPNFFFEVLSMIPAYPNICPISCIALNSELHVLHMFVYIPIEHDRRVLVVVSFAQWTQGVVLALVPLSIIDF